MTLINKFFSIKIECPRCLGKGHVDWDDIKRLKQELKWIPGSCAYCNGKGRVNKKQVENIDVNMTYLVTNLTQEERSKIINNDEEAHERSKTYEKEIDDFIKQIEYLYFDGGLEIKKIVDYFLISSKTFGDSPDIIQNRVDELTDYIERVIEVKNKTN